MEHLPKFKSSEFLYSKNKILFIMYDTEWSMIYSLGITNPGHKQGPLKSIGIR